MEISMKQIVNPVEAGAQVFGTRAELDRKLNVSRQTLNSWRVRGVPAERVILFSRVTGLPRALIRPDLYPNEVNDESRN
jgi:DNA-binding transcriptional regulator YdaS (Cro superfamily)